MDTTKLACTHCGSFNVLQEAYIDANTKEIVNTFPDYYCNDCEGECVLNTVPVDTQEN